MNKRSLLAHFVVAVVLVVEMAILVSYELSPWWQAAAVVLAIGITGSRMHHLTIGGIFGVTAVITIIFPLGILLIMAYYYDGRPAAFTEHMGIIEWTQAFAPTLTGVAMVWLRRRFVAPRDR